MIDNFSTFSGQQCFLENEKKTNAVANHVEDEDKNTVANCDTGSNYKNK